jgi:hypothetical protein
MVVVMAAVVVMIVVEVKAKVPACRIRPMR